MKNLFTLILLTGLACTVLAQTPVEIKDISGSGQKKFKQSPKRVFIAQFRVNFQLLYSQTETAEGGRTVGGGYRSEAKAGVTLAVQGISSADLLDIADKLYQSYVKRLQEAGYEVVLAKDAAGVKEFSGWEMKTGGTLNESQYPGYITVVPTGFEYFVKKTNDKGREKGTFTDNSTKISNDVKATAIKVNMVIPFVEDAESGGSKALGKAIGGLAKVVLRPNLRIEKDMVGTAGTFSSDAAQTKVTYAFMEGMGTIAVTYLCLKESVEIGGIFEDKKYKASESASTDLWGTNIGALTIFEVNDRFLSMTQPLPCDAGKYRSAVYAAGDAYLTATLAEFLSHTK